MIEISDNHDRFSAAHRALGAGVYHNPGWRAILGAYGLSTHWLVAERDQLPIGLLALVKQSSLLFGHRLISLPWVDESGAVGDAAAVEALLSHAVKLAQQHGANYSVSVKQPLHGKPMGELAGWSPNHTDKVLMRRKLAMPAEDLWKELSAKVRNQVRKGEKNGLVTGQGGVELIPSFYQVYAQNMRDLGSPPHSQQFFEVLVESLGDRARVHCVRYEGNVIGAGIVLDNRPSLDIPWASSLREFNSLCVNHLMYWNILADACEAGYEWFHFGRSSVGSGQHKFKKQWGAEETPLHWYSYSPTGSQPDSQAGPSSSKEDQPRAIQEKFGLAQRLWTKLPLAISNQLGPRIIRHVP